ncbi:MAG: hypothetical protein ABI358_03245 [Ginsengibacter sp.]
MNSIKLKAGFFAIGLFSMTAIFAQDTTKMPKRDTTKMPKADSTSMVKMKGANTVSNTFFTSPELIVTNNKSSAKKEKASRKIS